MLRDGVGGTNNSSSSSKSAGGGPGGGGGLLMSKLCLKSTKNASFFVLALVEIVVLELEPPSSNSSTD